MELVTSNEILSLILNDEINNAQIIDYLNEVIDEELCKDEPDCDLIDDCINAIYELENNEDMSPTLRLALTSEWQAQTEFLGSILTVHLESQSLPQ